MDSRRDIILRGHHDFVARDLDIDSSCDDGRPYCSSLSYILINALNKSQPHLDPSGVVLITLYLFAFEDRYFSLPSSLRRFMQTNIMLAGLEEVMRKLRVATKTCGKESRPQISRADLLPDVAASSYDFE